MYFFVHFFFKKRGKKVVGTWQQLMLVSEKNVFVFGGIYWRRKHVSEKMKKKMKKKPKKKLKNEKIYEYIFFLKQYISV